jgi:hypothetical protein
MEMIVFREISQGHNINGELHVDDIPAGSFAVRQSKPFQRRGFKNGFRAIHQKRCD